MALPKPTRLELQIMEALWTHGPCSVRKIQESFPARKVLRRARKIVTEVIEFQGTRIPQFALRAMIASRVGGACDIKTLRRGSQSLNTGVFPMSSWKPNRVPGVSLCVSWSSSDL